MEVGAKGEGPAGHATLYAMNRKVAAGANASEAAQCSPPTSFTPPHLQGVSYAAPLLRRAATKANLKDAQLRRREKASKQESKTDVMGETHTGRPGISILCGCPCGQLLPKFYALPGCPQASVQGICTAA